MKRTLILIFFLFSLSVRVTAQVTLAKPIKFVTSNPTVCSGNFQYNNTTTGDIFERLGSSGTACTKIVNASATSIVNNAPSGNLPVSAGPPTLNDSGIAAVKGAPNKPEGTMSRGEDWGYFRGAVWNRSGADKKSKYIHTKGRGQPGLNPNYN